MKAFRLQLRPHVKQYILQEYGPEPITLREQHPLGRLIMLASEQQPHRIQRLNQYRPRFGGLVTLDLRTPYRLKYVKITDERIQGMSFVLEHKFNDGLCLWIKARLSYGDNVVNAIKEFYIYYDINEDDYPIENARKVWRDYTARCLKVNAVPPDPRAILNNL